MYKQHSWCNIHEKNMLARLSNLFGLDETRCVACFMPTLHCTDKLTPALCAECVSLLSPRTSGFCSLCGALMPNPDLAACACAQCLQSPPPWDSFLFFAPYTTLLRTLLLRLKFQEDLSIAPLLGSLLAQHYAKLRPEPPCFDIIIPTPLHPRRLFKRGYNQALEVARSFARFHPAPIVADAVHRIVATVSQTGLSREERRRNLRGAFVASSAVRGHNILLLDDIITTGTTMRRITAVLRDAGATSVHVVCIARTANFLLTA